MSINRVSAYGLTAVLKRGYYAGGRIALVAIVENAGADGDRLGVLSVNLPDETLAADEFFIKTWSENRELAHSALQSGLFVDTGRRVPTGRTEASVWMLAPGVTLDVFEPLE